MNVGARGKKSPLFSAGQPCVRRHSFSTRNSRQCDDALRWGDASNRVLPPSRSRGRVMILTRLRPKIAIAGSREEDGQR